MLAWSWKLLVGTLEMYQREKHSKSLDIVSCVPDITDKDNRISGFEVNY